MSERGGAGRGSRTESRAKRALTRMSATFGVRGAIGSIVLVGCVVARILVGCGDGAGEGRSVSGDPSQPAFNDDPGSGDPNAASRLEITPASVVVEVVIDDGVVTPSPQPRSFIATLGGQSIQPTWTFDRGELGDVDDRGVFTASAKNVGEGRLTARYAGREGTATVAVAIRERRNGASPGSATTGFGGIGGVGGEPLGPPVDVDIAAKLASQASAPGNATNPDELAFLYPYDKTVWPRGLLPPLVMWQTNKVASAVQVKLSQSNYTFEGTYSLAHHGADSAARKRIRLEESAWRTATTGNVGDELRLEVKIYSPSDDVVYGPITRTFKVAPGVLKGTVYYSSYDSRVTTGGGGASPLGGIIKIRPRSPDPELAVPYMSGKCHACHVVSADGSTLFAQDGNVAGSSNSDFRNGASYDLTQPSPTRTEYVGATIPAHDHKFVWSAPYPDGSFALASSGYAREAYTQTASKLFDRATGAEVVSPSIAQVTSAVTPAFSPDGRKVAFNFWAGPGANGVTAGDGHSLAVLDFACGASAGSPSCAPGVTPEFQGLREIYRDAGRWPGWPSFLPDAKAAVFHNAIRGGDANDAEHPTMCRPDIVNPPPDTMNCQLTTWLGATAELWMAKDGVRDARRLDALNGIGEDAHPYLPMTANHPDDTKLNYMPTVNPVASGGYYWVVFTSRRLYGNLLASDPHADRTPQKKLWVAAIDIDHPAASPGTDPSHPAFYLPGQEIDAGNTRGFWVVDPCKANGQTCETGDECCNGFCRSGTDGLVCIDRPGGQCAREFEKCTADGDCCDASFRCLGGKCSRPRPIK
jgi:hypothetical protein